MASTLALQLSEDNVWLRIIEWLQD